MPSSYTVVYDEHGARILAPNGRPLPLEGAASMLTDYEAMITSALLLLGDVQREARVALGGGAQLPRLADALARTAYPRADAAAALLTACRELCAAWEAWLVADVETLEAARYHLQDTTRGVVEAMRVWEEG